MKKIMLILALFTCLVKPSCSTEHFNGPIAADPSLPNDVILEWNAIAYLAFGGEAYQHSPMASRINAMTHLAMHDALNAIYPVYESYAFSGYDAKAHPMAAAASAAHTVLSQEIPDKKQFLDSAFQQSLSTVPEGEAKEKGVELGKAAGQAILDARSNDGAVGNPIGPVTPSNISGVYQTVPPFDFIFAPYWQDVKPFGLQRKDQFRCLPYPSLDSDAYAEAFNEVKEVGKLESNSRTEDQNDYSNFWYEFSETGWNRVARTIVQIKKLGLMETARLFALVDIAMADAYIAGWESKFYHNLWRPYTAIRNAHMDENDKTVEDLQWEPAMPTPPVQDYPSTPSALGNAAATVLSSIIGDNVPFSMSSPTALPGKSVRSFISFKQAADENADSRVKAGIHFRFACDAGQELGDKVGQWVMEHHLKPLQ